jgi:hypothetical protein
MQASRWVLDLALVRRKKNWLPLSSNSAVQINLAYDSLVFNGLLFIWGALKKATAVQRTAGFAPLCLADARQQRQGQELRQCCGLWCRRPWLTAHWRAGVL